MSAAFLSIIFIVFIGNYSVYLYNCVIPYIQAFSAIIANFIRIQVANVAFSAFYTFSVVKNALFSFLSHYNFLPFIIFML